MLIIGQSCRLFYFWVCTLSTLVRFTRGCLQILKGHFSKFILEKISSLFLSLACWNAKIQSLECQEEFVEYQEEKLNDCRLPRRYGCLWCHEKKQLILQETETWLTGAYSEPCQTSNMEVFAEIGNSFQLLTIFSKSSILDVSQGSEYTCV